MLFNMFDSNHDKKISYRELIIGCSPDINNDNVISNTEFEKGKNTAIMWLANIICTVPNALSDNIIDLNEVLATSNDQKLEPTQDNINSATQIIQNINF